jgi:hypothetical protein
VRAALDHRMRAAVCVFCHTRREFHRSTSQPSCCRTIAGHRPSVAGQRRCLRISADRGWRRLLNWIVIKAPMTNSNKSANLAWNLASPKREPATIEPLDLRKEPPDLLMDLGIDYRTPGPIEATRIGPATPRDHAIIFRDLVGKLDMLRVDCAKCGRSARYSVATLIRTRGTNARLVDWVHNLTEDCPRRRAGYGSGACSASSPDFAMLTRFLCSAPPPIIAARSPELAAADLSRASA